MGMLPDGLDAQLIRYFSGQLPEQERAAFEAWVAEDPARQGEVGRLRALWQASRAVTGEPDTEAALARVKERTRSVRRRHALARLSEARAPVWRVAAAVVLLVGGALVWRALESFDSTAPAPRSTYATARAQRATLTLPDSSKVFLNTDTRLQIPASFGRGTRDVYLEGEAYFEVTHDPRRPFRVHTARAVTQVLGTRFGVRARGAESALRVAVIEGRVAVARDSSTPTVLVRGDVERLPPDSAPRVTHGVDTGRMLGWTEGRLAFDATPLPDVLAELSRWFDRDFVLGDSVLGHARLTTVVRGESLSETIAVLEAALDVKAQVVGRTVILKR
jgi:ferric-dicitrate binding protein FerR (iron transport regulator)